MRCSMCQKDVGAYYLNDFGAIICNDCGKSYTGRAYSASVKSPYSITTADAVLKHTNCYHCKKEIIFPQEWEFIGEHKFHKDCASKEQDLRRNGVKSLAEKFIKDNINPDHYKTGGIETIEIMKAKLTKEGFEGYLVGNVLKYITRYNEKNGLEDLKKARWYLDRLIKEQS